MAHKALLIGAATGELSGVGNDVTAMADTLERWGFSSVRCERENASRAAILDAYERLIGQARPDDAVLVYYSGHGAYAADPKRGSGTPSPNTLQLIVPTDIDESTEDDFRGITSPELSVLLARLTERTRNVTVVLDCCHSAHMSRVGNRVVKGRTRPIPASMIMAHIDMIKRDGLALDLWHPPGNPYAVRIVACAPEQQAFEAANADGVQMGYLTDALTRYLTKARTSGTTVSWATVMNQVRQRVLDVCASQRPEAEGPARRVVFDTAELDPVASLPVTQVRDRIRIAGAPLFGVRPGDEFVVMPDDTPDPDDVRKVGDVRVDQIDGQAAYGPLVARDPDTSVPLGARAHLIRTALPPLPVAIDPQLDALVRAVGPVPIVRVAEDGETAPVRVEAGPAGLTIHDAIGPLHAPHTDQAVVVAGLKRLARARALRCLTEEPGLALTTPVSIRFGRVAGGKAVPMPRSGGVVHSGQSICVTVRNESEIAETVYVSLLDVGVSGQISVLNPSSPSGMRLAAGKEYVFGGNDFTGKLPGMAVSWPASMPADVARPETIVVLVSSEPTETHVLTQAGVTSRESRLSRLERYLWQLGDGQVREVAPEAGRPVRFAVHTIDFDLVPTPAPAPETAVFQVDDRPTPAAVLGNERAVSQESTVRLYLSDLVVCHNRTFRCADVRFDTLVVTDGPTGHPEFHVHTERFTGINDGERLTLPDAPIFRGTARKRLDIAVWVAPDAPVDLAARLRTENARTASDLIDAAQGILAGATGLYRNILLGTENFGAAQHLSVDAPDFSFRCAVRQGKGDGSGWHGRRDNGMSEQRVTIGERSWGVDGAEVATVMSEIERVMTTGGLAKLSLLAGDRPVTVFFNGSTTVVVDAAGDARPTEISGNLSRPTEISGRNARPTEISGR
ncbi:caspase family protein [Actinocrispum wychmicini]|uniref:Caspase domain-containing protein n=1 Tax=Actinocrispum wychmicini TaxID=1213861 RepID=A0A4R2J4Z7_9PSEU|nr:caspase family protein [Actinocrispum wychmicini]TCO52927.1 caspase domain-containing protein [Actinocrispum wychmicini]